MTTIPESTPGWDGASPHGSTSPPQPGIAPSAIAATNARQVNGVHHDRPIGRPLLIPSGR